MHRLRNEGVLVLSANAAGGLLAMLALFVVALSFDAPLVAGWGGLVASITLASQLGRMGFAHELVRFISQSQSRGLTRRSVSYPRRPIVLRMCVGGAVAAVGGLAIAIGQATDLMARPVAITLLSAAAGSAEVLRLTVADRLRLQVSPIQGSLLGQPPRALALLVSAAVASAVDSGFIGLVSLTVVCMIATSVGGAVTGARKLVWTKSSRGPQSLVGSLAVLDVAVSASTQFDVLLAAVLLPAGPAAAYVVASRVNTGLSLFATANAAVAIPRLLDGWHSAHLTSATAGVRRTSARMACGALGTGILALGALSLVGRLELATGFDKALAPAALLVAGQVLNTYFGPSIGALALTNEVQRTMVMLAGIVASTAVVITVAGALGSVLAIATASAVGLTAQNVVAVRVLRRAGLELAVPRGATTPPRVCR